MRPPFLALILAVLAAALPAAASAGVGFQRLSIPDPEGGPPLEAGVWYPTAAAAKAEALELYTQAVAHDAPVQGAGLPLVVISHGHGGSFAGHYDTAVALAEEGFVAAAVTHRGDSWQDQSRATEMDMRPRQLEALTQHVLTVWSGHNRLDPRRVGAFGFSAGGFTALVLAGGEPDLKRFAQHCRERPGFYDCQVAAAQRPNLDATRRWTHDARIRAVVVASPALGFTFDTAGLATAAIPVQLWRGEDDPVLPHPFYAEAVRRALPRAPEMHVEPHMGHFEFLAPCPAAMAARIPEICAHEEGFDPAAFKRRFNGEVVRFFRRTLGGGA